jgi:hypothetical protein
VWLVFVLMLLPASATLGALGAWKDGSAALLAVQRDAVGRSVVLTGTLSDVDTTSGLPKTSSLYEVVLPDVDGGPAATVIFPGDEQWGFPPSSEYPSEIAFLVVLDDPPRAVLHGAVGSVQPVTEQTERSAEGQLTAVTSVWVSGIIVFWVLAVGLPVLAILLAVRRRRARRSVRPPVLL